LALILWGKYWGEKLEGDATSNEEFGAWLLKQRERYAHFDSHEGQEKLHAAYEVLRHPLMFHLTKGR
jgi:hypothetical protein